MRFFYEAEREHRFFPLDSAGTRAYVEKYAGDMMCTQEDLAISGNYNADQAKMFSVVLELCQDETSQGADGDSDEFRERVGGRGLRNTGALGDDNMGAGKANG